MFCVSPDFDHPTVSAGLRRTLSGLALALLVLMRVGGDAAAQSQTAPAAATSATSAKRLSGVKSWGYQLQKVKPAEIAASPYDLVVVDYSRNGTDGGRFTPADVKTMQTKPDGGRRIVLAYMSIGEAEDYRFYWNPAWVEKAPLRSPSAYVNTPLSPPPGAAPSPEDVARAVPSPDTVRIPRLTAPGWLGRENEAWPGNYLVRYWYEGWYDLIIYETGSYLERIQQAGFDGVYVDRVDVFYALEGDRANAASLMVDFVVALAAKARSRNPQFIVMPQNGEELVKDARYLGVIDGIAKEDLFFGAEQAGAMNSLAAITSSVAGLAVVKAAGLPVFTVEYLEDAGQAAKAAAEMKAAGFITYIGPRRLDRLASPR